MANKCGIECEWLDTNRLIVNPDGQVVPCCFFANSLYVSKKFNYPKHYNPKDHPFELKDEMVKYRLTATETVADPILRSYIEQEDDLNVNNKPLHEIVEHDWFNMLYQSWDDSNSVSPICVRNCKAK